MRNIFTLILTIGIVSSSAQVAPPLRFVSKTSTGTLGVAGSQARNAYIFGSGTLQGLFTEDSDESNQGTGSIGLSLSDDIKKWQFSLGYSIGANQEVIFENQKSFGNPLLLPGSGANSAFLDYRDYGLFKKERLGLTLNVSAGTQDWVKSDTTLTAALFAVKAGMSFQIFSNYSNNASDNKVMATLDFGYSSRFISGDVKQEPDFIENSLGTSKTYFDGVEISMNLWVNDSKISASFPILNSKEDIKGLTGGQLIISVSFATDLIKTKL